MQRCSVPMCAANHTPTLMETLLWSPAMRATRHKNAEWLFDVLLFIVVVFFTSFESMPLRTHGVVGLFGISVMNMRLVLDICACA